MKGAQGEDNAALAERIGRLVVELGTLFKLHLEKEERVYLPLVDGRPVAPPQRHPLIFGAFERLTPGQAFVLVNDHDPKPLYYQFQAELTGQFSWDFLERGPEVWRVRIGKRP